MTIGDRLASGQDAVQSIGQQGNLLRQVVDQVGTAGHLIICTRHQRLTGLDACVDGTAKGGVVVAICRELGLPVRYVGVGEKAGDLLPFDPKDFVDSLFE